MVDLSLKRLAEMRLPNGAYLYGSDYKYIPRLAGQPAARQRRADAGRQLRPVALGLRGGIDKAKICAGLDFFFKEHDYIEMGRKRQFPHESWYQTAPYYYYFGHYYAACSSKSSASRGKREVRPEAGRDWHPAPPGAGRLVVGLRDVGLSQAVRDGVRRDDAAPVRARAPQHRVIVGLPQSPPVPGPCSHRTAPIRLPAYEHPRQQEHQGHLPGHHRLGRARFTPSSAWNTARKWSAA